MQVALAEDGALFREGLLMLLKAAGHEVVACAASGDELVAFLRIHPADVAILDIRMPPEPDGGLVTAERLRATYPDMGLLFLSNQLLEYVQADFRLDDHAYGSVFYLMTGFHGLHVIGGLVFMGAVAAAIAGRSRAPVQSTVEVCGYYWHFVDVVWVAMFTTVYVLR